MGVIRTKKTRLNFPLNGGLVHFEMPSDAEKDRIKEKLRVTLEDGTVSMDMGLLAEEIFRTAVVDLEGYQDEDGNPLEFGPELVETIIEFDPMFFTDIMKTANRIYSQREDLATKNSGAGASGTLSQQKSKKAGQRAKSVA